MKGMRKKFTCNREIEHVQRKHVLRNFNLQDVRTLLLQSTTHYSI